METRDDTAAATKTAVVMDADSDWEYEVSTETETHLITLDLSLPEFVRRRDDLVVHNTRGGFRSWLNPLNLGSRSGSKLQKGLADDDADGDNDGDNDGDKDGDKDGERDGELAEDSDNDEHNTLNAAATNGANTNTAPDEPDATDIQVLELHTAEPIIAYRGMLFRGAWHDTIGTEMLFASRDENSLGVPVVPDVDLVGAASARIACTHTEVRPRGEAQKHKAPAGSTVGDARGGLDFIIPIGNAASRPRQKQAGFLEQLMALKHKRGEPDVVTVQALDTKHNAVRGDAEEAKRRARQESLLQVHQERRAKRLRDAEAAAAVDSPDKTTSTTAPRRARRVRLRRELSPLATVAGDDVLAGVVAGTGKTDGNGDGEGDEDGESISERGNDSGR